MKVRGYRERRLWMTDEEARAIREYLARLRRPSGALPETPGSAGSMSEPLPETPKTPETDRESWYDQAIGWALVAAISWVLWRLLF